MGGSIHDGAVVGRLGAGSLLGMWTILDKGAEVVVHPMLPTPSLPRVCSPVRPAAHLRRLVPWCCGPSADCERTEGGPAIEDWQGSG